MFALDELGSGPPFEIVGSISYAMDRAGTRADKKQPAMLMSRAVRQVQVPRLATQDRRHRSVESRTMQGACLPSFSYLTVTLVHGNSELPFLLLPDSGACTW